MSTERTQGRSARARLAESITLDALLAEVEGLLIDQERDAQEHESWPAALAQIRISKADAMGGVSESPERQLRNIARYCVQFGFRPVELCFEAQSGHLTDKRPRRLFEAFRQRIESGDLRVAAVLTYNIDRFTRDRFIGEQWLVTLKNRGVDLHEVDEMEAPLPLAQREEAFASAFLGAWRSSKRNSKRIRDVQQEMVKETRLLSSVDHFGHRPRSAVVQGRRRQVEGLIVEEEAELIREASHRLAAGERLYRIVTDFGARGVTGRNGGAFTSNSLGKLLISVRLIGKQRCQGEMVDAPIAPILTEEEWARNCELLTVKRKRGRPANRLLAGLGVCGACGARTVTKRDYYVCSRPQARNRRRSCDGCGMPDGRCRCTGRVTAADGLRHAGRKAEHADRFVVEVALAAYDVARVQKAAEAATQRPAVDAKTALEAEIAALENERRTLARQERQGFVSGEEAGIELAEIMSRLRSLRAQLGGLRRQRPEPFLELTAEQLREKIADAPVELLRTMVSGVIRRVVFHEASTARPYGGIELEFVEGYEPPAEAVEALRQELLREFEVSKSIDVERPGQTSKETEELIFQLWSQGTTNTQISARLTGLGFPSPKSGDPASWTSATVSRIVRRACKRRGIGYVPHKRPVKSKFSQDVRDAVFELAKQGLLFPEIARQLDQLGLHTPDGVPWTAKRVVNLYANECRRRSATRVGRRPGLPADMRRLIWNKKRILKLTHAEVAQWLNETGVKRPNRKPWDAKAVQFIVVQEDRRLAEEAVDREPGANGTEMAA